MHADQLRSAGDLRNDELISGFDGDDLIKTCNKKGKLVVTLNKGSRHGFKVEIKIGIRLGLVN